MRLRSLLASVAAAAVAAAPAVAPAAAASTADAQQAARTAGAEQAASIHATRHTGAPGTLHTYRLHRAPRVHLLGTYLPHLASTASMTSTNWSGYAAAADSGQRIRYVAANFNVPSLNCANSPRGSTGFAYASHWAGLDGLSDTTIEHVGVQAFCDSSGTPSYLAFYQMYPQNPVGFTGSIGPGDAISVSVFFNGSAYSLMLTDQTSGASMSTVQKCPSKSTCSNKSAEVITEDPGGAVSGGVNLADFGMVNYTGTVVTSLNGTHGSLATLAKFWTSTEITMQDSSQKQMAVPSGLYGGKAFDVAWRSAT